MNSPFGSSFSSNVLTSNKVNSPFGNNGINSGSQDPPTLAPALKSPGINKAPLDSPRSEMKATPGSQQGLENSPFGTNSNKKNSNKSFTAGPGLKSSFGASASQGLKKSPLGPGLKSSIGSSPGLKSLNVAEGKPSLSSDDEATSEDKDEELCKAKEVRFAKLGGRPDGPATTNILKIPKFTTSSPTPVKPNMMSPMLGLETPRTKTSGLKPPPKSTLSKSPSDSSTSSGLSTGSKGSKKEINKDEIIQKARKDRLARLDGELTNIN